jgi:hypothetical protein
MWRLFLAGLLILIGTSAILAQEPGFGFNTFCKNKACRYEVQLFNIQTAKFCSTARAVGQDCFCFVSCGQNRLHKCLQAGVVVCR